MANQDGWRFGEIKLEYITKSRWPQGEAGGFLGLNNVELNGVTNGRRTLALAKKASVSGGIYEVSISSSVIASIRALAHQRPPII
jgi:hypothetical protein